MVATALHLPDLASQARRLIELGLVDLGVGALSESEIISAVTGVDCPEDSLLVPGPNLVAPSKLAPLLSRAGKPGFVVVDMTDLDDFAPIAGVDVPEAPFYVVSGLERGDEMANWSPDEALPAVTGAGRTPMTIGEGIAWLLQQPEQLEPNHCFMTIGSRLRKANGKLDARTPAIWISGGTGRDGRERKGAPKVGWCWAGNRHTWLGFGSVARRFALTGR
ncbi:DUF5701 family protein [Gordonia sp. PKS22-38]|uniref:DUF5701 family protein n=1 Tax=Gordonia prachuapensis TaxID=3115651 RepID=A0ABU7MVQ9_9ACTN|nr:DUF5701 family protein [Gordonia sp. PKS22-38]